MPAPESRVALAELCGPRLPVASGWGVRQRSVSKRNFVQFVRRLSCVRAHLAREERGCNGVGVW